MLLLNMNTTVCVALNNARSEATKKKYQEQHEQASQVCLEKMDLYQ